MAETKKNTNSKKNNSTKKSTNTKGKNTTVKKNTNKVNDTVKESKKVTEKVVVEEKKNVKNEDSFARKHFTDIMLVAAAVIVVIIGVVALGNKGSSENYLVKLSYNQYVDMQESGEPFAFIVESATCVHCQNFMPIVKKFVNKNEVYVYYIDLNELSEEDYTAFLQSNTFFEENEKWGTPTTLIVTGHEVSDTLVGETTEDKFKEFLVNNGIME